MTREELRELLKCDIDFVTIDFEHGTLDFYAPPLQHASMWGAIAYAEKVCAEAEYIYLYCGGKKESVYRKTDGRWGPVGDHVMAVGGAE